MLGELSARYESARDGSRAIGWDRGGHLSLGKYQIAHATGTLKRFIEFCEHRYPDVYKRLEPLYDDIPQGPESKKCEFAQEWVRLAKGGSLKDSEHRFIKTTHFDPVYKRLPEDIKIRVATSGTLQQILWSMSVQHRGSTVHKLFLRAYYTKIPIKEFIMALYDVRTKYVRKISKLRQSTRASLVQRYQSEQRQALKMLEEEERGRG